VLVGSGWSSVGVSDKRLIIDVSENKMGTVLVDDHFLSRDEMNDYVIDNNDSITIRCRIRLFDDEDLEAAIPQPTRFLPPAPPGISRRPDDDEVQDGDNTRGATRRRQTRRDHSATSSRPAKRRRLQ